MDNTDKLENTSESNDNVEATKDELNLEMNGHNDETTHVGGHSDNDNIEDYKPAEEVNHDIQVEGSYVHEEDTHYKEDTHIEAEELPVEEAEVEYEIAEEAVEPAFIPVVPAPKVKAKKAKAEMISEKPVEPKKLGLSELDAIRGGDFAGIYERNKKYINYALIVVTAILALFIGNKYLNSGKDEEAEIALIKPAYLWENDSLASNVPALKNIVDDFGSTVAGNKAKYILGNTYLRLGKYEDAIDMLNGFDANGSIIMGPSTYGMIGDAYSQLKDYDAAVKYYGKASNDNNNSYSTPMYLKKAALVYELQLNNYKEALSNYKKIKNSFPNTRYGQEIEKYIGRVEAKLAE
ncbi:MAG: tetratricopeptide repeat protein [Bacteroidota bacterium]|nr:tetratricopeptide repeat protein [Bacteroidota bacterium]